MVGDEPEGASFEYQRNLITPCYAVDGQNELDLGSGDEHDPEEAGEDLGTERPRVIRSPHAPSRQEVIEHNITHCPFSRHMTPRAMDSLNAPSKASKDK